MSGYPGVSVGVGVPVGVGGSVGLGVKVALGVLVGFFVGLGLGVLVGEIEGLVGPRIEVLVGETKMGVLVRVGVCALVAAGLV